MPIDTARSIGRLGFRKWYERQLIESHAWLVTCLLCGIAIAASLELLSFRNPGTALVTAAFVFTAGLICWHAVRRYGRLMAQAERLAHQTTCGACAAYARFSVLEPAAQMRVRCRKCGNEWTIT